MQGMMTLVFATVITVVIVWKTLFRFSGLLRLKFNHCDWNLQRWIKCESSLIGILLFLCESYFEIVLDRKLNVFKHQLCNKTNNANL